VRLSFTRIASRLIVNLIAAVSELHQRNKDERRTKSWHCDSCLSPSDAEQVVGVAGRSADGTAGGVGLTEKRSQPLKSTTVSGPLSHAGDDHPRRRMLGHEQGSRRPLRGQPVTTRSAGRGGKA